MVQTSTKCEMTHSKMGLPLTALCLAVGLLAACSSLPELSVPPTPTAELPLSAHPTEPLPQIFGEDISFEHITLGDGISQSWTYSILQDRSGFIWFGSEDGLFRYDGTNFRVYRNDVFNEESVSSNIVWDLLEDSDGVLWVATEKGLNRFDPVTGNFTRYQHIAGEGYSLAHDAVIKIMQDAQGNYWVGTRSGGMDRFDPTSGRFIHYRHDPRSPFSLSSDTVRDIFQDDSGTLWVGTDFGLDRLDRRTLTFAHFRHEESQPESLSNNEIRSIAEDAQGYLWVGTAAGVNRFDPRSGNNVQYRNQVEDANSLSDDSVWGVFIDTSDNLWVATNNGLNLYRPKTDDFRRYEFELGSPDSLNNPSVYTIYQDRSGAYWLGTLGGRINRFDQTSQRFVHYSHNPEDPDSLSGSEVNAVLRDSKGILWVGTTQGLNRRDENGRFIQYTRNAQDPDSLSTNMVTSLYEDSAGSLWVGTSRGLDRYDAETDRFIHFPGPGVQSGEPDPGRSTRLSIVRANTMLEDDEGRLWIGTQKDGLLRYDPGTDELVSYTPNDTLHPLGSWTVLALDADGLGNLWVGTLNGGLSRIDMLTGAIQSFVHDPEEPGGLIDNTITAIMQDSSGRFWIGANSGLYQFDTLDGSVERTPLTDTVYSILEDEKGDLWASTNTGIVRFEPVTETLSLFDRSDGLQGSEFKPGSFFVDGSGNFYFGGLDGLTVFNPGNVQENPYLPPVVLTGLTSSGVPIDSEIPPDQIEEFTLHWPDNSFDFTYAALSYIQPEENRFAYMLEGLETTWNMAGTIRNGRYTNLEGGNYTLRIIAANNDGVWNYDGLRVRVRVVPPIWQTNGFRWGAILLIAGSVALGYRMRLQSIQERNRQLALQVSERTKEIEQRRQVAEGLRDVINLLNNNKPLEESLNFMVCQIKSLVQAQKVLLARPVEKGRITLADLSGTNPADAKPCAESDPSLADREGSEIAWLAEAVKEGRFMEMTDASAIRKVDAASKVCVLEGMSSAAYIPILLAGEAAGGFLISWSEAYKLGEEEKNLLGIYADQAALAIGNERLHARAAESAVLAERTRLARDLHDAVTQTLFSASLIADALPDAYQNDHEEGQVLIRELRQLTRGALAEMRSLLMELRPSAVMEARLGDLLRQLAEALIGRTNIVVKLDVHGDCRMPDEVHMGLYRIAQESITNIIKHAKASKVNISLLCEKMTGNVYNVTMEIRDNGRGFDPTAVPGSRFGLLDLRERAQAIGAELNLESSPGKGAKIQTIWRGKVVQSGK
jgi:ligand-binding sensor domain-containing protein/signal transduction histidine kinase